MSLTDPFDVLRGLAPRVGPDDEALAGARSACEQAIFGARRGRRGMRGRWLPAVAVTVAALTIGATLWPGQRQPAVASWTSTPSGATAAQANAAENLCDTVLANATVGHGTSPLFGGNFTARTARLAEQRGEFTFVLSSNDRWVVGCLAAPEASENLTETGVTQLDAQTRALSSSEVEYLGSQHEATTDEAHWARVAYGRVGSQVAAVDIATVSGPVVHATVANGYWTAWWPTVGDGNIGDARVTVSLGDGTRVPVGTLSELQSHPRVQG